MPVVAVGVLLLALKTPEIPVSGFPPAEGAAAAAERTWVERTQPDQAEGVPAWVPEALPMALRPGQAQVSDGWRQVGLVTVEAAQGTP